MACLYVYAYIGSGICSMLCACIVFTHVYSMCMYPCMCRCVYCVHIYVHMCVLCVSILCACMCVYHVHIYVCTWMDLYGIMLSEMSEENKCCMTILNCGI